MRNFDSGRIDIGGLGTWTEQERRRHLDAAIYEVRRRTEEITKWPLATPTRTLSPIIPKVPSPKVIQHPKKDCPIHKELDLAALSYVRGNPFTKHSHEATPLRDVITHFVGKNHPTKVKAARCFPYDFVKELQNGSDSDEEIIETYLRLFDELYFFGSLRRMTTVKLGAKQQGS